MHAHKRLFSTFVIMRSNGLPGEVSHLVRLSGLSFPPWEVHRLNQRDYGSGLGPLDCS